MEGSESEAVFESLNLNPQLFINEVLNSVDDLVDEAFNFFHEQASKMLKSGEADRSDDLCKGVACVRNKVQSAMDRRLNMWEKYCLRHCFVVPEGFSMSKADESAVDTSLDLDALDDTELDAQLESLRNQLTLIGRESADLNGEIQQLERQSTLISNSSASIDEVLQLYEKYSMHAMFQELVKTTAEFQGKVDKMKARRMEEIECGRAERMNISNGEILKATPPIGLHNHSLANTLEISCEKKVLVVCDKIAAFCVSGIFDTDLGELEELLDEMKTV